MRGGWKGNDDMMSSVRRQTGQTDRADRQGRHTGQAHRQGTQAGHAGRHAGKTKHNIMS